MMRASRHCLAALPFVPMALTTLEALESKLQQSSQLTAAADPSVCPAAATAASGPGLEDSPLWFDCEKSGAPFFITPKHDGIRMVTYVHPGGSKPTAADKAKKNKNKKSKAHKAKGPVPAAAAAAGEDLPTTTYSRHGRTLYGMFWIEKELALLRALALDPHLVLDGELYIHRVRSDTATTPGTSLRSAAAKIKDSIKATKKTSKNSGTTTNEVSDDATEKGSSNTGDVFKCGFLAVNALANRMRGSKRAQCSTVAGVLQYVATLPHYCLFDVASHSPGQQQQQHQQHSRQVTAELRRVLESTLASMGLTDTEELRCVPNVTPFSQRVRTLHFLTVLLSNGVASPILRAEFGVGQPEETAAAAPRVVTTASNGTTLNKKNKKEKENISAGGARRKKSGGNSDALVSPTQYTGGVFVKMIPCSVVHSLADANTRVMPQYERQGYEGAVIRSPVNAYAMREKKRGVVSQLVAALADMPTELTVSLVAGGRGRRTHGADIFDLAKGRKGRKGSNSRGAQRGANPIVLRAYNNSDGNDDGPLETAVIADDSGAVAKKAVDRVRHLPRRSATAVKLLPFKDREYAVLRPLLKEPSSNPRARQLFAVPVSAVCPDDDRSLIKPDPSSSSSASSPRKPSDTVVFYGLQCLAENGSVFNVTMPKLTMDQQRELLRHLLAATRQGKGKGKSGGGGGAGAKSLTGTYVTVKFASLTEHGVPRFAQVKAIRGGKGWHM